MKRRSEDTDMGLDSFLDIVTNVIGVMILIAVSIAIQVQDVSVSLGTPLLQNPPSDAEGLQFECINNRIVLLDHNAFMERADEVADQHFDYTPTWDEYLSLLNSKKIHHQNYNVTFEHENRPLAVYAPKGPFQGDDLEQLATGDSEFEQAIVKHNPDKKFTYFLVREDSFAAFRKAREIARAHGFSVGWQPLSSEYSIRFYIDGGRGEWGGEIQ